MMRKAWSGIEEMPYCFSRSSVKFQGHIALKIVEFNPNWAFPDCNSRLNSPMAMKCCTKRNSKEEMPYCFPRSTIKFHSHTGQNITDFDPNWAFPNYRPVSDLPCWGSSALFLGHTAKKIVDFDPNWAFPDCSSNFNSPMGMKWYTKFEVA